MLFRGKRGRGGFSYRRGQVVEVRSLDEILATLDAGGRLAGLPFMPEMARFCGRKLRIYRRADKVFLDRHCYVARLRETVLLEDARCDGQAHAGCQMRCVLFWKEAWLKPALAPQKSNLTRPTAGSPDWQANSPNPCDIALQKIDRPTAQAALHQPQCAPPATLQLPLSNAERFCCQATELVAASARLPWWDLRQYVRDLVAGETTPRQLVRAFFLLGYNKIQRMCGREPLGVVTGAQSKTAIEALNLQPGELVQVKSRREIEATLDSLGRNRGLGFAPEMVRCCGGSYRVAGRVEKLILEWSGEMRQLSNTVVLEGAKCDGVAYRLCPRSCYHLWRETWLRRVPAAAHAASGGAASR